MGDDFKVSEFNEAALKMTRIHELQRIINIASINKLSTFVGDEKTPFDFKGKRNYEIIFECLNQLFKEIIAKIKNAEEIIQKRNVLREFLRQYPIMSRSYKVNGTTIEHIHTSNWVVYEQQLDEFEESIKILIDKHGFAGKESKDPSRAVIMN